jgi:4-diphosphocytidyl-2-C-methyl-D-erythritol kinase
MIQFPNCKINLGLNVISKRSDGFHNLETIFYPVPLHDALEIMIAADGVFQFHVTGFAVPGGNDQNLCVKAFRLLQADFGLPEVKMHLHKAIPMGSGLGGGSSDGAFTLKMLNDLFTLGLDNDQLKDHVRHLGSDCAFFIENYPQFAIEKGEQLEPVSIDLSGLFLVLVFPDIHIVTTDAYKMVLPRIPSRPIREVIMMPMEDWKDLLINDFEKPVLEKYPVIGEIKQKLYDEGAVYSCMTGSGSAVFGFFKEEPHFAISPFRCFTIYLGAIL